MRFSLMGPLHVDGPEGVVQIRGTLRRTLLAVLLLHADTVVSADRLTEHLWGPDEDPAAAENSLYNQLMRLRQSLGDAGERVRAVPPGYLIHVEPGELDLQVFADRRRAGGRALAAGDFATAEQEYRAALDLWRGDPLSDLPALAGHPSVQRLAEDRLQVVGGLVEARLQSGRHEDVIADLAAVIARHPLHQSFHGQLMLALYRAGRQSAALDAYQALRELLLDELGVEPATDISTLHERIRSADESLLVTTPTTATPSTADSSPAPKPRRQLPADTRLFTGREPEMNALLEVSAAASAGTVTGAAVVSALNGMGGVGKSALAIHVAHRISESFPDGQLFVDLHGHTAGMRPLRPLDALHQLLRSLDCPPHQMPTDVDECAALYRSTLAGTKTLIVLDDAAGTAQVRPLLPAEPGCFVLITSRAVLTGLDDARTIGLDVLPEADCVTLLRKVAGPNRVPADHPAVGELVCLCGRIPLAVRIAAARLRHHPHLRIEDLVDQLRSDADRLQHLRDDDRNLTALFDASYDDLDAADQRLFRLLGLVPGPDVDVYAAANLTDTDPQVTRRQLDSLVEQNLLAEYEPGRYRLHDLLRAYARTRVDAESPESAAAALTRLLDYYRHTALAADKVAANGASHHHLTADLIGPTPAHAPDFPDEDSAQVWLATELPGLLAALASEGISPAHLIALTTSLAWFLRTRGPWARAAELHEAAATVAREAGDGSSEGMALIQLSQIQHGTGQIQTAIETCERAMTGFRSLDDLRGEAVALDYLAEYRAGTGEFELAMEVGERALGLYRDLGDKYGMAITLWNLGRVMQRVVDPKSGVDQLMQARELFAEIGNTRGEAVISAELGRRAVSDGRFAEAVELYDSAISVFAGGVGRQNECMLTLDLCRVRLAQGEFAEADRLRQEGVRLAREFGFSFGDAIGYALQGQILAARGEHAEAAAVLTSALELFRDLDDAYDEALTCMDLGQSEHALGHFESAADLLHRALAGVRDLNDVEAEASVMIRLAALEADTVGSREAVTRYEAALEMLGTGNPPVLAEALEGLARCLAPTDPGTALTELRKAVALYREMGAWQLDRAAAFLAELEGAASEEKY